MSAADDHRTMEIVMPTIASDSPTALRIGSRLGAGMWISSPTGGARR